jgi:type VI secretion system protein
MMLLTLSVISAQGAGLGSSAYRVFDSQGGTIGRVDANDWVLPDPAKFVSSHHARIRCHNNVFYLQDLSTNGTFLNSPESPVSKSDLTALGDGDRILIGDYEILVQLIDDGVGAAPESEPVAPAPPAPASWAPAAASAPLVPDVAAEETADPLLLLGGNAAPRSAPPRAPLVPLVPDPMPRAPAPPPPQGASHATQAHSPATPAAGIPDDWQLTGFNMPAPQRPTPDRRDPFVPCPPPPSPVPVATQAPPPPPPQRPTASPHAATLPPGTPRPATIPVGAAPQSAPGMTDDRIAALFAGLGVDPDRVSPETFAELGEILRVVVQGMIDVLQSRTEVKNNFRVPMTTMRPVENNPLKFSMNVEDAIHNLFVKRNPGYLQPVDAFREGFRDVAYHQVAMLSGIRTAFNALLARFDPEGLQETYERKLKRTLLLGVTSKLKYWDLYCEQFEEFDRDAESTFQNLFGEEFAKAYFEQLQQLATTARLRKR